MGRAETVARAVLAELGIVAPPVPVHEIADRLGAQIVEERMDRRTSGLLYREPGRTILGVNSLHPWVRQRFTVAHELGHLRLHPGKPIYVDQRVNFRDEKSSLATDRDEIQANAFAAELLMPAALVLLECRRAADADVTDRRFVADLAAVFDVSEEAMGNRLTNLGIRS